MHEMFKQLFNGRLACAPIDKISLHNVLDIATGTDWYSLKLEFIFDKPTRNRLVGH